MSDPVMISMIAAVQGVVIVLINKFLGEQRATVLKEQVKAVEDKVDATHQTIDGRMEQLIIASKSVGAQEQRAEDRQDANDERKAR